MEMKRLIRRMLRRQQRMAYFFICFLFLALAVTLARTYGRVATFALCAGFIVLLEIGYRRLMIFEARNRRRWWARQHNRPRIRFYFYLFFVLLSVLLESSFARYALLSLLAAGLVCAGAIRLLRKDDSDFSLHLNDESRDEVLHKLKRS